MEGITPGFSGIKNLTGKGKNQEDSGIDPGVAGKKSSPLRVGFHNLHDLSPHHGPPERVMV
jgi:hypothetical protein